MIGQHCPLHMALPLSSTNGLQFILVSGRGGTADVIGVKGWQLESSFDTLKREHTLEGRYNMAGYWGPLWFILYDLCLLLIPKLKK